MFGCPRSGEYRISAAIYFWVGENRPELRSEFALERTESGVLGAESTDSVRVKVKGASVRARLGSQVRGVLGGL